MSCIYNPFEGICSLYNEDNDEGTNYTNCEYGWDEMGNCCVDEDPCPNDSCSNYEPY